MASRAEIRVCMDMRCSFGWLLGATLHGQGLVDKCHFPHGQRYGRNGVPKILDCPIACPIACRFDRYAFLPGVGQRMTHTTHGAEPVTVRPSRANRRQSSECHCGRSIRSYLVFTYGPRGSAIK